VSVGRRVERATYANADGNAFANIDADRCADRDQHPHSHADTD
jgi:hypothetical protein